VIDFFCGLDNFTLPIAKYVRHAVGVEGSSGLIERAKINAKQNDTPLLSSSKSITNDTIF
jgi:23S rRNA (uracil1939-C5)-methyltransferase